MSFYQEVNDQVENLTPFGEPTLVPRLEAWYAAAEVLEVPRETVSVARYLQELVQERRKERGVHSLPIEDLLPLPEPS